MDREEGGIGRGWWIAAIVLALAHLALSVGYARATPMRQAGVLKFQGNAPAQDIGAPDERQHVNYITHLAQGKGLPVFNPQDPNLYENYQFHQPPLYYSIASVFAKGEATPERSMGLRYLNGLIGAVGVLGVFFAIWWGWKEREWALGAAAIAALLPMNVALSGAVSNDPLLFALIAWTCGAFFRNIAVGWTLGNSILLGALAGAAVLTKTSGIAVLPALLAGVWAAKGNRPCVWRSTVVALTVLILVGPWWARNTMLYGDPLAMKAFSQAFTGSAQASMFVEQFGAFTYWTDWVGWWTLRSFLGVFGYMDVFLGDTTYRVWMAFLVASFAAGAVAWAKRDRVPGVTLGVLFVVVIALFWRFNTQYFQAQARYLLPALVGISALIAGGITLLPQRTRIVSLVSSVAVLLALNLWILNWLPGEFARRIAP